MNAEKIRARIDEICSHFLFTYRGLSCGVDPLGVSEFDMWCGDKLMTATSIDEVMSTPFFSGKSLQDIAEDIEDIEE